MTQLPPLDEVNRLTPLLRLLHGHDARLVYRPFPGTGRTDHAPGYSIEVVTQKDNGHGQAYYYTARHFCGTGQNEEERKADSLAKVEAHLREEALRLLEASQDRSTEALNALASLAGEGLAPLPAASAASAPAAPPAPEPAPKMTVSGPWLSDTADALFWAFQNTATFAAFVKETLGAGYHAAVSHTSGGLLPMTRRVINQVDAEGRLEAFLASAVQAADDDKTKLVLLMKGDRGLAASKATEAPPVEPQPPNLPVWSLSTELQVLHEALNMAFVLTQDFLAVLEKVRGQWMPHRQGEPSSNVLAHALILAQREGKLDALLLACLIKIDAGAAKAGDTTALRRLVKGIREAGRAPEAPVQETPCPSFKKGDRVKYVHKVSTPIPGLEGSKGTVVGTAQDPTATCDLYVKVAFDEKDEKIIRVQNLQAVGDEATTPPPPALDAQVVRALFDAFRGTDEFSAFLKEAMDWEIPRNGSMTALVETALTKATKEDKVQAFLTAAQASKYATDQPARLIAYVSARWPTAPSPAAPPLFKKGDRVRYAPTDGRYPIRELLGIVGVVEGPYLPSGNDASPLFNVDFPGMKGTRALFAAHLTKAEAEAPAPVQAPLKVGDQVEYLYVGALAHRDTGRQGVIEATTSDPQVVQVLFKGATEPSHIRRSSLILALNPTDRVIHRDGWKGHIRYESATPGHIYVTGDDAQVIRVEKQHLVKLPQEPVATAPASSEAPARPLKEGDRVVYHMGGATGGTADLNGMTGTVTTAEEGQPVVWVSLDHCPPQGRLTSHPLGRHNLTLLPPAPPTTSPLKEGDRVVYKHAAGWDSAPWNGRTGVVKARAGYNKARVSVAFDTAPETLVDLDVANLVLAPQEPPATGWKAKEGDRVIYQRGHGGHSTCNGKRAKVLRLYDDGSASIVFEGEPDDNACIVSTTEDLSPTVPATSPPTSWKRGDLATFKRADGHAAEGREVQIEALHGDGKATIRYEGEEGEVSQLVLLQELSLAGDPEEAQLLAKLQASPLASAALLVALYDAFDSFSSLHETAKRVIGANAPPAWGGGSFTSDTLGILRVAEAHGLLAAFVQAAHEQAQEDKRGGLAPFLTS